MSMSRSGLPTVRGILCDGTGMGMSIVANKHAKIYAANCDTVEGQHRMGPRHRGDVRM